VKILLDTHTFIWMDTNPKKLSHTAQQAILNTDNDIYLSVVSIWEIQIKQQLGKLKLPLVIDAMVAKQQDINDIQVLPLQAPHIYQTNDLPTHHKDPFDRLLMGQSRAEGYPLVTVDGEIHKGFTEYVELIW
jgi:PIN domain nuclease of toxin-antitoxin system